MNTAQEVVLLGAIGVIGVMLVIPPWSATHPKGDTSHIRVFETGPTIYHSIFREPPRIWRSGREYIPEINTRRLSAQCGSIIVLAPGMMILFRNKKEETDWPNCKNQPWNAGGDEN